MSEMTIFETGKELTEYAHNHPASPVISALVAEVEALIVEQHPCEWGTAKCCGTCAYWNPIDTSIEKDTGECGTSGTEWHEHEFCSDWVEKE